MTRPLNKVVQQLRRAALTLDGAGLSDDQLLRLYISNRDDAAFAALMQRHGPMVWGVCRRILGSHHEAEDAFQATFLVLVRKAASIGSRELLAGWLYGVAHNTARKAKAMTAKRRMKEMQATAKPGSAASDPELADVLDRELSRLPEKYRLPVVLCELEGKTRKQAAEQLGWPEGTVAGRLARARALLAQRLARQGLTPSGAALAALLAPQAAPAAVMASTLKIAGLWAAGETTALISANVAVLTEGALKTMLLTKLRITVGVFLAVSVLASGGTGAWIYHTQAAGHTALLPTDERPRADRDQPAQEITKPIPEPPEPRKQRMLRWSISFDHKSGNEYVHQFEALGATLAVPSAEEKGKHRVIRDLSRRPIRSTVEDISKVEHIFWVDNEEASVRSLAAALGLEPAPQHFIAFLPRFIEDEMVRKELAFAQRKEEDIAATTFRFFRADTGYELKVVHQRAKERPGQAAGAMPKDVQALQGAWNVVAVERLGGRKLPEKVVGRLGDKRWVFNGDEYEVEFIGRPGATDRSGGSFKIDPAKTPKELDLVQTKGTMIKADKPATVLKVIYKLEGDTLTVCYSPPGKARPSRFDTTSEQGGFSLLVLKREGPAKVNREDQEDDVRPSQHD